MITNSFELSVQSALASDPAGLATASHAPILCLFTNALTLTKETVKTDLVIPTADGLAAIPGVAGNQTSGRDPITLRRFVDIKEPAGGFRWQSTGDMVDPVTVYGWGVLFQNPTNLAAAFLFPAPIILNPDDNEAVIEVPSPRIYLDDLAAN